MPRISVIVPIYNVESYLRQCIESILSQIFTDFELILVDDGSHDGCSSICNEYIYKDNRIKLIHKKNGGLSDARNAGIEIAAGEYLAFVDSDDWISPEFLQQLYEAAEESKADIAICGFKEFIDGEECPFESRQHYTNRVISGKEACVEYYSMKWTIPVNAWTKLYKAELFKNIRFPKGRVYEDQGTVPKLWSISDRICHICDGSFYAFRVRNGSITHKAFSSNNFDDVWNVEQCRLFFMNNGEDELEKASRRFRDILQAKYVVRAHANNAEQCIPAEYKMKLNSALKILRNELNDETYSWYLQQVRPWCVRPHSWIRKVKSIMDVYRNPINKEKLKR